MLFTLYIEKISKSAFSYLKFESANKEKKIANKKKETQHSAFFSAFSEALQEIRNNFLMRISFVA